MQNHELIPLIAPQSWIGAVRASLMAFVRSISRPTTSAGLLLTAVIGLPAAAWPAAIDQSVVSPAPTVTDAVLYRHLFRHVAKYQQFADAAEASGAVSPFRHAFRRRLTLTPNEEEDLNRIASDCMKQLEELDGKAVVILEAFRAAYPVGQLQTGISFPTPPAELHELDLQRKQISLGARDQLRMALGEQRFAEVDARIRVGIGPQIEIRAAH